MVKLFQGLCLTLAALLLSASGASEAYAFECTPHQDYCFSSVRWEIRTIPYIVRIPDEAKIDRDLLMASLAEAFGNWQSVECSDIAFEFKGIVPMGEESPIRNEVIVVTKNWTKVTKKPNSALAVTRVSYGDQIGQISHATIFINDQTHKFVDAEQSCGGRSHDLLATMTHEVGHFLGFAHPCEYEGKSHGDSCPTQSCTELLKDHPDADLETVMWPEVSSCETDQRFLKTTDSVGLCFVYPLSQPVRQDCRSIVEEDAPDIGNAAFGCNAAANLPPSNTALPLLGLLFTGLCFLSRRRRPTPRHTTNSSTQMSGS